jgi:glycosyltransferase involved in cell wall biosynthesis
MVPLLKRDIGLRLVIAGEDHGEARNILSLVHQLRLDGSVILTGRLSDGQANGLLQNCDVFAFPSTGGEAFGISLLSAMQAARAVVATQLPGAMDLIRSGENGVIVRAAEPLALRSAISNLLEDSELALELGNQARDDTALLTWERASLKTAEVLERVAGYSK